MTALICTSSISQSAAQDALQIQDDLGNVLGPVVSISMEGGFTPSFMFAYDQGGNSALFQARYPGRISQRAGENAGGIYFYYLTVNCTGTPAMTTFGDCCQTPFFPIVIPDGLGQLWVANQTQYISPLVGSRRAVGNSDSDPNNCEPIPPAATQGFALTLWGTLTFTPPLHVVRNPFIFGDDFSSGNPAAWSNF